MPNVRPTLKLIADNVKRLANEVDFREWLRSVRAVDGDGVLVNNSFLFREQLKTRKSHLYPLLEVGRSGTVNDLPLVVTGEETHTDFRLITKRVLRDLRTLPLPDEIERQLDELGSLPQVLIGTVLDDVEVQAPLNHSDFRSIVLRPGLGSAVAVENEVILVADTYDAESLWLALQRALGAGTDLATLKVAFNQGLDRLEEITYARLVLPTASRKVGNTVLAAVAQVLQEQRDDYAGALDDCAGNPDRDPGAYNELLRIAYNFASDVAGLIRLVTSISDLKPVLLWTTLADQFDLANSFRKLPWLRSRTKPSLDNYLGTVGDARNSSFHHLFPFRKTLEVQLPSDALLEVKLRIFSEFRRKKENQLRYRDKELIDLLTEFTRAGQRRVPPHFWRQNLAVMDAALALFRRTEEALLVLYT